MDKQMKPGGVKAVQHGCTCPVIDNHHGAGRPSAEGPTYWITDGCPLHSRALQSQTEGDKTWGCTG